MKIIFAEPLGVDERLLRETQNFFERLGHIFEFFKDRNEIGDEIIRRTGDADILTISNIPVPESVIEKCKNLKLINVAFTGVDHVDLNACKKHKVSVCNAAGYSTVAVAELSLGLAIGLLRNIPEMDSETRRLKGRGSFFGTELYGKTVGIVGTGAIGMKTAKLFHEFGCDIIAYNRTRKSDDFISYVSLEKVFTDSDIISLHIPSTEETKNLVDRKLLSLMKDTAVLINTARGQIVDYDALSEFLNKGRISGAGIDVYDMEPPLPADHPILSAPNTILLPHIGYATKESMVRRLEIVKNNILSFIDGKLQNRII